MPDLYCEKRWVNLNADTYISLLKEVKELSDNHAFDADVDFYNMEYYYRITKTNHIEFCHIWNQVNFSVFRFRRSFLQQRPGSLWIYTRM